MVNYIVRRFLYMIVVVILISMISFIIIQLPPGDYLSSYIEQLERSSGVTMNRVHLQYLVDMYGLDLPVYRQYLKWMSNIILRGDFGESMQYRMKVMELIGERVVLTMVISFSSMLFVYVVSIPIGIYSATHQYSPTDYVFTFFGFIGLATPNFMLALVLMFLFFKYLHLDAGGLFSVEFAVAPWSMAKVWDMLKHFPIPIIVLGTAGTAGMIRVMRGNLLDELHKQYVITARAKGLTERRILFRYPLRLAMNPVISGIGHILPALVSGATITSVVLSLPTTGPILLNALRSQDMYVAASALFLLSILTVIGIFISDMLLVVLDPRIRYTESK